MTDPHADFMRTIIASPADDAPRLVYADWLEEHGGEPERAEFIRLQIRIAHTPEFLPTECNVCGNTSDEYGTIEHGRGCYVVNEDGGGTTAADDNPKYEALRRRERELDAHKLDLDWLGFPFTVVSIHPATAYEYRRGFCAAVRISWQDWLAHHAAIIAATPLERVRLTATGPVFANRPDFDWRSGEHVEMALQRKWPGISFELPAIADPVADAMDRMVVPRTAAIVRDGFTLRLGRSRPASGVTDPPASR